MNLTRTFLCVAFTLATLGKAIASPVPHTFTNGGVIDANAVNENFTATALPVGTVIASVLTEAQFQSASGSNWVVADGRDVTGSGYATLTGNTTLPDLRGAFLRGKNNGRSDGKENPDGDLALGNYQGDDVKSHTHGVTDPGHSHNYDRFGASALPFTGASSGTQFYSTWSGMYGYPSSASSTGISIDAAGGAESRPRNVTINYFIKIN